MANVVFSHMVECWDFTEGVRKPSVLEKSLSRLRPIKKNDIKRKREK